MTTSEPAPADFVPASDDPEPVPDVPEPAPAAEAAVWPAGPIGVLGTGAVGTALAAALRHAGLAVRVGSRDAVRAQAAGIADARPYAAVVAECDLVLLAVPDGALAATAAALAWRAGQWAAHCAGSLPASALTDAVAPALAGAWHPLAAIPRRWPDESSFFAGRVVAVDGPPAVAAGLSALAERLGARPVAVPPAARAAYHLSAALASNGLVALVDVAAAIWSAAGLDVGLALPALLPLVASAVANLERVGLPAALTGPIARGDVATVARHLAALQALPEHDDLLALYRQLGRRQVALARALGHAAPADLDAIADLLR